MEAKRESWRQTGTSVGESRTEYCSGSGRRSDQRERPEHRHAAAYRGVSLKYASVISSRQGTRLFFFGAFKTFTSALLPSLRPLQSSPIKHPTVQLAQPRKRRSPYPERPVSRRSYLPFPRSPVIYPQSSREGGRFMRVWTFSAPQSIYPPATQGRLGWRSGGRVSCAGMQFI